MKKKNIIIMSLIVVISIILLLLLKGCEKKYTVTFDTNGGTKIDSVKVTKNTKVDIPTKVEKEGYIFGGFTDEEGLLVSDHIEVTKNITLTARWISKESETINVTYIIDDNTKINVVLEKNSSIVKPRLKDRKGYIFGGYLVDGKILTDDKIDTDTDIKETLSNESVKKNAPAHKYGEYGNVLLTDSQFDKLKEDYGESEALKAIDYLDQYIKRKGYKAKDHYLTIRKWVFDTLKEDELKAAELKEREARIKARGKPPDKHGIQRGIDYDKLLIDAQKETL